jgi:hypothetical protein
MDGFVSGSGRFTTSLVLGDRGETTGKDGSSRELSNPLDLEILKSLRRRAALIQTSVRTANAENYRMPRGKQLALFADTTRVDASNLLLSNARPLFFGKVTQPNEYTGGAMSRSCKPSYVEMVECLELPPGSVIHSEFGLQGLELTAPQLSCIYISAPSAATLRDFTSRQLLQAHQITAKISISNLTLHRLDESDGVASDQESLNE